MTDGDTLNFVMGGKQVKVRLNGINAPEFDSLADQAAKKALSGLIWEKPIRLLLLSHDGYRRTIAELILPDGRRAGADGTRWLSLAFCPVRPD